MTRKRSRYARQHGRKPWADPLAAFRTLQRAAAQQSDEPMSREQLVDLAVGYHGALKAMVAGQGNEYEANTLSAAANIAILLCEAGLGADMIATALAGRDAVVRILARHKATGRWGVSGSDLVAIQALLDLHDAQLESPDCAEGLVYAAVNACRERIADGHVVAVPA